MGILKRNLIIVLALAAGILGFGMIGASPVHAEEEVVGSGMCDGVPWKIVRITSFSLPRWDHLIIGEEGKTYSFDYKADRDENSYPWTIDGQKTYNSKSIEKVTIKGHVKGNGSMACMFYGCNWIRTLDLSGFDTSDVTNMQGMFDLCGSLTTLDLSGFDTGNVRLRGDKEIYLDITDYRNQN